ncbi:MAG: anion permease [Terriglobia bacterium]
MLSLLVAGVLVLAFANGANDNFKGVATLWGTGRYRYQTALLWGTAWTFAGGLLAIVFSRGLVAIFNGSKFLGASASLDTTFLAAVALGGAATVLLATRLGAPISTTHALTGALVGSGMVAVGIAGINFAALAATVLLPLIVSPLAALTLTRVAFPPLARWLRQRSCVCVTEAAPVIFGQGEVLQARRGGWPGLRITHRADCERGDELARWNTEELVHWSSAGLISFSRGLNDTPKMAALVLSSSLLSGGMGYLVVGAAMAVGGLVAAQRVARTMAQRVTPIEPVPGMSANLVSAVLVGWASRWGLPVSTTHVTLGSIFGLAARERERANWPLVGQIAAAWVVTLPLGFLCGYTFYLLLQAL